MKKRAGLLLAAGMCVAGAAFADPELKISAGFKLPAAVVDMNTYEKGRNTKFGQISAWNPSEDFKFDFHTETSGIVINLKPRILVNDGKKVLSDDYNGSDSSISTKGPSTKGSCAVVTRQIRSSPVRSPLRMIRFRRSPL